MKSLGPYVLERKLGSGGMGVVYLARHPELGLRALKLIHTHLSDAAALVRFEREFQALAALAKHPHVVKVHTTGFEDGRLYYVMDAIDGEDLQDRVDRGPLPPREAVSLLLGITDAVASLHAAGVVHRDLKPANILVDRQEHAFLTDFGLARLLCDERGRLTMTGELIGTPDYMAPEQALGLSDQGPPVDVYALGLILYTLLSGQVAIQGKGRMEALQNAAQGKRVPLVELAPQAPLVLADWIDRCLALEPADRPSAAELRDGLRSWLDSADTRTAGGVQRRERTRLRVILGTLLLLLALGVGAGLATTANRRASWTRAVDRATAAVDAVEAALAEGTTVAAQDRLTPARAGLAGVSPPDGEAEQTRSELLALLAAVEADRATQLGDRAAVAKALEAVNPPSGLTRDQRQRLEAHTVAAKAWQRVRGHAPAGNEKEERSLTRELTKARERWPDRDDLLLLQAELALTQDRPGDARDLLEAAASASPTLRVQVALESGDLPWLESLLQDSELPPSLEARALLALAAAEAGPKAQRALERVNRAWELQPEGLEGERDAVRQAAQGVLDAAGRGWGRSDAEELIELLSRRIDMHSILEGLDPAYELAKDEIRDLMDAIFQVGGRLQGGTRGAVQVLERMIDIGPDHEQVYMWYARFATTTADYSYYRRALVVTDYHPSVLTGYARALGWGNREQELTELCALFESKHGDRYPRDLANAYLSLANKRALRVHKNADGTDASPATQVASLESLMELFEKILSLAPDNWAAQLGAMGSLERLLVLAPTPERAAQARRLARGYVEVDHVIRAGVNKAAVSDVEYATRILLRRSRPEDMAETLALADQVLGDHPLHLWLAFRRLELALERQEDVVALAAGIDLPARVEARQLEVAKRILVGGEARWAPSVLHLQSCESALARLQEHLEAGRAKEAAALLTELREGLPEHRTHRHPYAGASHRL